MQLEYPCPREVQGYYCNSTVFTWIFVAAIIEATSILPAYGEHSMDLPTADQELRIILKLQHEGRPDCARSTPQKQKYSFPHVSR